MRRATLLLLIVVLAACHVVFDGELGPVQCVDEGRYGPPTCAAGQTCVGGMCTALGAPVGQLCGSDAECRSPAICFDPSGQGVSRCTRLCCSAADCGQPRDGQVCWPGSAGNGNFCWPAAELGRAALGEGTAGQACDDGTSCRSGLCDGRCVDTCCGHSHCGAPDEVCRLRTTELAAAETWACGNPPFKNNTLTCDGDQDCASGKCLPQPEESGYDGELCAQPCCSSMDCPSIAIVDPVTSKTRVALVACEPALDGTVRACNRVLPAEATGWVGDACESNKTCRSGLCLADGYCSDSCCNDESCGDTARFSCVPQQLDGSWALRCVRK